MEASPLLALVCATLAVSIQPEPASAQSLQNIMGRVVRDAVRAASTTRREAPRVREGRRMPQATPTARPVAAPPYPDPRTTAEPVLMVDATPIGAPPHAEVAPPIAGDAGTRQGSLMSQAVPVVAASPAGRTSSDPSGAPDTHAILRVNSAVEATAPRYHTTAQIDEVALINPDYGEVARFKFAISDLSCTEVDSSTFRCAYDRSMTLIPARQNNGLASFVGQVGVASLQATGRQTRHDHYEYSFIRTQDGWTSPEMSAALQRELAAADQASAQGQGSAPQGGESDFERWQREREFDRQQQENLDQWMTTVK